MNAGQYALQSWRKAEDKMRQAAAQPQVAPDATVHLSYYAMFHAARAGFLAQNGTAPKKHTNVIGQFGLLMRDRGAEWTQASSNLHTIYDRRIKSDYVETARVSTEDAEDSLVRAQAFLDLCAREFSFPREQGPSDA